MKPEIIYQDLGLVDYASAWDYQEELMQENLRIKARHASQGKESGELTSNYLLLCEHPHVYTLGKSGHMENLLVNDQRLKELNVSFFKTNRGGDITYHGPGQVVGYPILDLEYFGTDLGKYMRNLEEVIIRVMARFGIIAGRLQGCTGVWIDGDIKEKARKICAMGVKCSRWVTMHGFALNVNSDLSYFNHIVPCGIVDKKVTSMARELGGEVNMQQVRELITSEFGTVFGADILEGSLAE